MLKILRLKNLYMNSTHSCLADHASLQTIACLIKIGNGFGLPTQKQISGKQLLEIYLILNRPKIMIFENKFI